ncbi:hypothetical protein Tco_0273577 [Tanacetum coccineum]
MANLEFYDTHNMVAYLNKLEGSEGFHQIFWQTATASTLDNEEMEITATINGKVKIVTEASIRRHLKFIQIFLDKHKRLLLPHARLYIASTLPQKLFSNMKRVSKGYTGVDIPLFQTMLVQGLVVQGEGSTHPVESHQTPIGALSTSQLHLSPTIRSSMRQETEVPQPSSPTHTHVADEAVSFSEDDKMVRADTTVSSLEAGHDSDRVIALETDLKQTKKVFGDVYTKLIKKVKKDKLSKSRRKLRLVLSDEEDSDSDILAQEDPSKQGRKIAQIDEDKGITLIQICVSTASIYFTIANVPVTTAGAEVGTASPEVKIAGDFGDDIAAKTLVYIRRSAAKAKDKGKGIMEESESAMTKTKRQQEQERLGLEAAVRLQEEFDEEERQRIARVHEAARSFTKEEWEDIRVRIEA